MTLNAVVALILRFLRNSTDFQADYITVVDRPIMSVNVSQFRCSTFGENYNAPCSAVSLRQLSILFMVHCVNLILPGGLRYQHKMDCRAVALKRRQQGCNRNQLVYQ